MEVMLTSDEAAEIVVVLLGVAEYLQRVDDPLPAFALRGVAESLARAIEPPKRRD
jgi:hypothetical protein